MGHPRGRDLAPRGTSNVAQSRCTSRYVENGWRALVENAFEEVVILLNARMVVSSYLSYTNLTSYMVKKAFQDHLTCFLAFSVHICLSIHASNSVTKMAAPAFMRNLVCFPARDGSLPLFGFFGE
jgi:hypothetical protein